MSCNTKTSLAAVIDAVNAQLNNNYVDRDDPRIDQGVFTEPTIRGGLMLDEAAKLDFCGYVTECGQREPFGKQWVDRPLYPYNTLVSYEDEGEIKSRWQDIDDVVAGTEIGESYTAYEETRNLGLQGYTIIDSFELGATLTQRNEALRHAVDGKLYRWAGDLPKVVPASSTPTSSGGMGDNAWLEVSDVALRQDLANPDKGAALVARAVIYAGSVGEIESMSLPVGTAVYLTEEGRAGEFVVKAGTPPSDPQKGIYIVLSNGNYAERQYNGDVNIQWFGAVSDWDGAAGTDNSVSIQAAMDLSSGNVFVPSAGSGFYIGATMDQPPRHLTLYGTGVKSKIVCGAPLLSSNNREKTYGVLISHINLHSVTGASLSYEYPSQTGNQEYGIKCLNVRFTGADCIRLVNHASPVFVDCEVIKFSGTGVYMQFVINAEFNGGKITNGNIPINIDGVQERNTSTAGIAFNGTRIIGNSGESIIQHCDHPSMINVMFDFNGTLRLINNIGGRFTGYFASTSENVISYSSAIVGAYFSGRFAHYAPTTGVIMYMSDYFVVEGSVFQNALHHIKYSGNGGRIIGSHFQQSEPNTRCIERAGNIYTSIVEGNTFQKASSSEAFPEDVTGMSFSNNTGSELDDVIISAFIPGAMSAIETGLVKKKSPKSGVCNTHGFALSSATSQSFKVRTVSGENVSEATAVSVTLVY